ncbi:hypothetical protein ACEN2J_05495 [Pseudorhodobacter sp. W20_MBD10_FR17]|uniref:hypothetical protein n=1 Tax=Pseudorhodobacter sp. W20_MBD10_FR17 TaxID=3240266 RepID=UPI003F97F736
MPDNTNRSTYVRETKTSSGAMAFIVGGLVVAVAVIGWFMFGNDVDVSTGAGDSTTTNVTIQPTAEAPAADAPAPAPQETAPAAPAGN